MSLKEISIRDFISKINWKSEWSYQVLEEQMKIFLGERPSLDIKYKKDIMINEVSGESKEINKLDSISVIFTDTDDKIKSIKIIID